MRSIPNNPTADVSPLMRAEAVKREYQAKLATLIDEYQTRVSAALADSSYSPAYRLGEIASYVSRLGRVMRRAEYQATELASAAEQRGLGV